MLVWALPPAPLAVTPVPPRPTILVDVTQPISWGNGVVIVTTPLRDRRLPHWLSVFVAAGEGGARRQVGIAAGRCRVRRPAGAPGTCTSRHPAGALTAHTGVCPHHYVRWTAGSDGCAVDPRPLPLVPGLSAAHVAARTRRCALSSRVSRHCRRPDWRTIQRLWLR
eukprot:2450828-Rhodomonas_salina.2